MNIPKPLVWTLLALLTPVTIYALLKVGYLGILTYHLPSPAGWQVITDLVVALVLVMVWMIWDARQNGRNVLPYLVLTLLGGSFGPLAYLLLGTTKQRVG